MGEDRVLRHRVEERAVRVEPVAVATQGHREIEAETVDMAIPSTQ